MKNDGGPAYPITGQDIMGNDASGLSIRDWFAGQALAGLLADAYEEGDYAEFAERVYGFADAMLVERAKTDGRS